MTDWLAKALAARACPFDPARDFCQWPYRAPYRPAPDALRSEALLYAACAAAGFGERMEALLARLHDAWGRFETVWGVKWAGGALSVELYFYDYDRTGRRRGLAQFRRAVAPVIDCAVPARDDLPYFMFSAEIDAETLARRRLDQVDLYLGNPGSSVSSGLCYGLGRDGSCEFRNAYFFFDARTERECAWDKLTESVFVPPLAPDRAGFFWPEMEGMEIVVVANKRHSDALYFSRIDVDSLSAFLARLGFPEPLQAFLAEHRSRLRHHLFDAGWDFRCEANGHVIPMKGGFYGLL